LLFISIGVLWVFSTSAFSSYILASLERRFYPTLAKQSPSADAIVVLGGSVGAAKKPRIYVDLTGSSDRVLHAARLYHSGKAPIVIAVGGASEWRGFKIPEAPSISKLLSEWGVPTTAVIIESESLNTHQNAFNTKRLLEQRKIEQILLVTSAVHMLRALKTFRKMGINTIPSPTDYRVVDREKFSIFDFLPDAEALSGTTQAIKEYLGLMVYRWRGWIK